jgi:catechol 2,3-dioxygenase-like lactoylglutathione lyase family enzyme
MVMLGRAVRTEYLESLILFVSDLTEAKAFYADALELPVVFEDQMIAVVGNGPTRVVLHRDDRGHDERGIFPSGSGLAVWHCGSPSRIRMHASERLSGAGCLWSGRHKKRRGDASSCWPTPMVARSCSPR